MGDVKTYDYKFTVMTVGGVPITGFADGTGITVEFSSPSYTKTVGADGEVARTRSNDDTAKITITLLQTSLSNDWLSSLVALDKLANAGKVPVQIKDLLGTTVLFFKDAWVNERPSIEFGKELSERAWILETGQISIENIGGNI